MKITRYHNPLKAKIELTEQESREFWLKVKIELLIESIFTIEFETSQDVPDPTAIIKFTHSNYLFNKEFTEEIDRYYKRYLEALLDIHLGDCTSMASSCMKCHAEHILGIDTLAGLHNHHGHYIHEVFNQTDDINEAIEKLKNYTMPEELEIYAVYIDIWKKEAAEAAEWLTKYKDEYFFSKKNKRFITYS